MGVPPLSTLEIWPPDGLDLIRGTVDAERHPAAVYLARLASGSRLAMRHALGVVVGLLRAGATIESIAWHRLRYQHTQALRSRLAERYAPATVNRMLCAVRGVLKEAFRLGTMSAEDYQRARDVGSVRGSRLLRGRALTLGETRALFQCSGTSSAQAARDRALLAILYGAGLRRSEAVHLDLSDYDAQSHTLKVLGKGNKQRAVPLSRGVAELLDVWINIRSQTPGRLFLPVARGGRILSHSMQGAPRGLTGQAVLVIVRKLADRSGVVRFSPHDTRRTFISELLDAGADLSTVQQLVGHANVNTTVRYDRRGERAQRRAVDLIHIPS